MLLKMNKNFKIRAIPEKDWPRARLFDSKIKYVKTKLSIQNPFKSEAKMLGDYEGYFKDGNVYGYGTFKYEDEIFTEENFTYCGEWK